MQFSAVKCVCLRACVRATCLCVRACVLRACVCVRACLLKSTLEFWIVRHVMHSSTTSNSRRYQQHGHGQRCKSANPQVERNIYVAKPARRADLVRRAKHVCRLENANSQRWRRGSLRDPPTSPHPYVRPFFHRWTLDFLVCVCQLHAISDR